VDASSEDEDTTSVATVVRIRSGLHILNKLNKWNQNIAKKVLIHMNWIKKG